MAQFGYPSWAFSKNCEGEKVMRKRRMRRIIEDIKLTLVFAAYMIGLPLGMFLWWLAFGY